MKKLPLKKRLSYWFDRRMSGGSVGLIRLLAGVTLLIILLIACIVFFGNLGEEGGFLAALWDSLSTVINAWMPSYADGGIAYVILMSLAAIVGLFVTSVLIGIISSAIEEKITGLKRGTSEVIEEGHIVILGFYPGEYTLLRQLVLAAAGKPDCVVIVDDVEQEEMQQHIRENVEVPKNFRIVCRTADILDPRALERCAIRAARSVIISPTDDFRTTKALLAVSAATAGDEDIRVSAIISHAQYRFPPSIAERHHVTTLQTSEAIAKILAHSCMEPGLSETFREVFNYEGADLYLVEMPAAAGLTFAELTVQVDDGVPVGLCGDSLTLNPPADRVIAAGERVLVFAEERSSAHMVNPPELAELPESTGGALAEAPGRVTVIGGSESLFTVLQELPENVREVLLANVPEDCRQEIREIADAREHPYALSFYDRSLRRTHNLTELARMSEHVVILSDYDKPDDEADMDSIFLLLNLRDIRTRLGLSYNITAEMRREYNQNLVVTDDNTDFVVASNMSSLFLAQLSASPELLSAFRELLSNTGSELYLKEAAALGCLGAHSVAELRRIALARGYVLLGYLPAGGSSVFNPPLEEQIALSAGDQLIVVGEF